jgi:hypothetical protein
MMPGAKWDFTEELMIMYAGVLEEQKIRRSN